MFDHKFKLGVQLHHMLRDNRNIFDSVMGLVSKIINVLHYERFDPRTVEFQVMSPAGQPNTLLLLLKRGEYVKVGELSAAEKVKCVDKSDTNYKLVHFVDSLYKIVMGNNPAMFGYIHTCPALCDAMFAVCRHIYNRAYYYGRNDFRRRMVWDSYDDVDKDLIIKGSIPS